MIAQQCESGCSHTSKNWDYMKQEYIAAATLFLAGISAGRWCV